MVPYAMYLKKDYSPDEISLFLVNLVIFWEFW